MTKTFSADVDEFIRKSEERVSLVVKYASQELFEDVLKPMGEGGRMRVDTGFLRASARITLDNPVLQQHEHPGGELYSFDDGAIALTINRMRAGQTLFMTFTANYARHREYGARGQAPDAFVSSHVALWQQYVDRASSKVVAL